MENNRAGYVGTWVKGSYKADENFKWDSPSGPNW